MSNHNSLLIVHMNNTALSHFLACEYEEAIASLRTAFDIFQAFRGGSHELMSQSFSSSAEFLQQRSSFSFVGQQGSEEPKCKIRPDSPGLQSSMDGSSDVEMTSVTGKVRLRQVQLGCCKPSSMSSTTYFSMYNRALVLSDDQDDESLLVVHQQRTCAILLYNLALVHHNVGIHLGISAALKEALRLYEHSFAAINQGSARVEDIEKLLMALLNNMGNIHTDLYHFENTQTCMSNLRMVLAASHCPSMLLDEDYVFFFLNALFQGKELCFAPAA